MLPQEQQMPAGGGQRSPGKGIGADGNSLARALIPGG